MMSDDPNDDDEDTTQRPVIINIDDDPDNANWLRILAKRREDAQVKPHQPPPQSPQKPS